MNTAMTPAELLAECERIAAICGARTNYVTVHVMSGITTSVACSVTVAGEAFRGSTWAEMFGAAEAHAHRIAAVRYGGALEYDSWFAPEPAFAMAAE